MRSSEGNLEGLILEMNPQSIGRTTILWDKAVRRIRHGNEMSNRKYACPIFWYKEPCAARRAKEFRMQKKLARGEAKYSTCLDLSDLRPLWNNTTDGANIVLTPLFIIRSE